MNDTPSDDPAADTGEEHEHATTARAGAGMRIRSKILAIAVAPMLLFLVLGWRELPRILWDVQLAGASRSAMSMASLLARRADSSHVADAYAAAAGQLLYISITGAEGDTVAVVRETPALAPPRAFLAGGVDELREGHDRVLWVTATGRTRERVVIGWSLDREIGAWYRTRLLFTAITLATLALAALVASVLARRITRPLERITESLGTLTSESEWDLSRRFGAGDGRDETAELGRGMDRFIAELSTLAATARAAAERVVKRTLDLTAST